MRLAAILLAATALTAAAAGAPITVLDRNGASVAVEAYGPNVVHVVIATDKGHEAALFKLKEDIEEQKRHSHLK